MKKLLRIIALIILVLVGCFLTLRYVLFPIVPVDHLYQEIPDDADYVILIDTDELLSLVVSEILSNPRDGNPFADDEEKKDDALDIEDVLRRGLWNGLEIPEQLIVYQQEIGDQPFIVLLPLSDSLEFQSFLVDIDDRSTLEEQSPGRWVDSSHTLDLAEDYLRLCIGIAEPSRDLKREKGSWADRVKFSESGAVLNCFMNEANDELAVASLFSNKGGLRLDYEGESDLPLISIGQSTQALAFLSMQVGPDEEGRSELLQNNGRLSSSLRKVGLDPLALDSIWDGRFDLCVNGLHSVQEEVVSYSFNDDFEKVEQRELKNRVEAEFTAVLGLKRDSDSLFYHRAWVKNIDGKDLFVSYPFQEVDYKEAEGKIYLRSTESQARSCINSLGGGRLLHVDIAALASDWNSNIDSTYVIETGMSELSANISHSGRLLTIHLGFLDKNRQGLFSLFDSPILVD